MTDDNTFPMLSADRFRLTLAELPDCEPFEFIVSDHYTQEDWESLTEYQRLEVVRGSWVEWLDEIGVLTLEKGIPVTEYEWDSL
jgi:hypothetical protein